MRKLIISFVIPVFNRYHLIGETLDSLRNQKFLNWECLIIDDHSKDYINELMEFYCIMDNRIHFLERPPNRPKGANACRNYGFLHTNGEFVIWLDSDDVLMKNILEKLVAELEDKKFIIYPAIRTDASLKPIKKMKISDPEDIFSDYLKWNFRIITNSIIFRKSYLEGRKLFDEDLLFGHETTFFARIFFNTNRSEYKILNYPVFYYRTHEEGISQTNSRFYNRDLVVSHFETFFRTLKLSIERNDASLIRFHYKKLIEIIFVAVKHKDFKVINLGIQRLSSLSWASNQNWILMYLVITTYASAFLGINGFMFKRQLYKWYD